MQARLDLEQTEALLDEMLEANARWLLLFEGAAVGDRRGGATRACATLGGHV